MPSLVRRSKLLVLRFVIERLLAAVFALVGLACLLQGLAVLVALLASAVAWGGVSPPAWLVLPLLEGGCLCAILFAGGALLGLIRARSGRTPPSWRTLDPSVLLEWVGPATVPTLLVPAVAVIRSVKLFRLWQEILGALARFVSPKDFRGADEFSGLALFPILVGLAMLALVTAAGLFLILAPPLVLVLLVGRSHAFALNGRRTVLAQSCLVAASLLGVDLLARLTTLATPHLRAAGPESAIVLRELARAQDVLGSTVTSYAALVLVSIASLWLLARASAHVRPADEPSAEALAEKDQA